MSEQLWIDQVRIDRWGRASGFQLDFPDGDFVVLFGDNESGKTSLATALAWLLAGPGPRKLLHAFGSAGEELVASLRGRLGSHHLKISSATKVNKIGATGRASEQRFSATLGDADLTRVKLTTQLKVGDLDSYRRFYWLESLSIADQPCLTDDLSMQAQFGGIDPYRRSRELYEERGNALGGNLKNPAAGSALRLCKDRRELNDKSSEIVEASARLSEVSGRLGQEKQDRNRLCRELAAHQLAVDAIDNGLVEEWNCRARRRAEAIRPSPSERKLHEQQAIAGEAIGRLAEVEERYSTPRKEAEHVAASPQGGRQSIIQSMTVGCTAALAAVLASFADRRLFGLVIAGACVAASVLVRRHRNRRRLEHADRQREERLERVREFIPGVNDAAGARALLEAACERVEDYKRTVSAEENSCRRLQDAVKRDDRAVQLATEVDRASLSKQIKGLKGQLRGVAEGEPSINRRIAALREQKSQLEKLSNEAPDHQLQRGQLTTQIRDRIVQGLGYHLAASLLHDAAEQYRKAHQPELLRRTERLVSKVADWTDISVDWLSYGDRRQTKDEHKNLPFSVSGPHGEHPDRRLSFGARSLLFLMFRLAVVAERGEESGVRLPVILDDVLVGIDDERAKRCVIVINEFSKQHQVILLTCHKGTARLAEEAGAEVLTVPPRPAFEGT